MSGQLDPWDRTIYQTLLAGGSGATVTLEQLSAESGLSAAVLQALERMGILIPRSTHPTRMYDRGDADALKAGRVLLEGGVPLDELLSLAERMDEAMRPIAARAVDVFVAFVRDSVEFAASSDTEATERLLEAYRTMISATGDLVAGHFRRILLETARSILEDSTSS